MPAWSEPAELPPATVTPATMPPASLAPVSFEQDIHPLLASRCFACHGGDRAQGRFSMATREAILDGGASGSAVELGDSAKSYLIELVAGLDPDLPMPPDGPPLSDEEVGKLRRWIDDGLPWEFSYGAPGIHSPTELRKVEAPRIYGHPVDLLLTSYFREYGLARPEPIDDRAFIRRASLDVIGLLPTPEQVAAFESDPDPDKRAKLIRTLLDDDIAYAEHWMTFWNDALRNDYVGTGYIDGGRSQITQWLWGALASNMPYDKFTRGLVNPSGPSSSGFINGIVWRGVINSSETPPMQAARGVAQVFMGINLKCASCHDSFVDHWTLEQAYGLAAAFSEESLELVRCDVNQGVTAEPAFLWGELGGIDAAESLLARREQVAELVTTPDNGWFSRAIVNRLWASFYGRGIVEPLEQLEGPPWHGELMDWLAKDFIDHDYDVKHLIERMLTAKVYQWPSIDREVERDFVFEGPLVKRLSAEQFLDSLAQVTGVWPETAHFEDTRLEGRPIRAWRTTADTLMVALGRPNREQIILRREEDATTLQALEMTNGDPLYDRLEAASQALTTDPAFSGNGAIPAFLFERAFQREPLPVETEIATSLLEEAGDDSGIADLLWIMALSPEFQYIR